MRLRQHVGLWIGCLVVSGLHLPDALQVARPWPAGAAEPVAAVVAPPAPPPAPVLPGPAADSPVPARPELAAAQRAPRAAAEGGAGL